jgi:hypothetical protein
MNQKISDVRRRGNKMKWLKIFTMMLLLLGGFSQAIVFENDHARAAEAQTAVVNIKSTVVRSGPGIHFPVIAQLKSGTKLQVYAQTPSGWSETIINKKKGYVATKYLKFPNPLTLTLTKYKGIHDLKYPQVKGLKNRAAQDKINAVLSNHIKMSHKNYQQMLADEKAAKEEYHKNPDANPNYNYEYIVSYTVNYNQRGLLSIVFSDYIYSGGAHGGIVLQAYNFNIANGQNTKLFDVLDSKAKQAKVQKYAYDYVKKDSSKMYFVESIDDIPLSNDTVFYYKDGGIALVFQQYEIAPYASGNPEIFIPNAIYQ